MSDARITILLCTLNGAAFLKDQLASYQAQTHQSWDLWASDDGSSDGTWEILQDFAETQKGQRDIRLIRGPGEGLVANYISALCHPDFPKGPVALSDQDDVWLPEKLERAMAALGETGPEPILYGAQCMRTEPDLTPITPSPPPRKPAGFANALVQNVVSGNTTVLNQAALEIVRRAGVPDGLPYHDWWLYQLISGAGGQVHIDDQVVALYRQHGDAAMGAHRGFGASLTRLRQAGDGTYAQWVRANWAALAARAELLAPEPRAVLEDLLTAQAGSARWRALRKHGLYRQGRLGQILLEILVRSGKI